MSETLKYHYSNPKFEGLPYPANKKQPKPKKRRAECVKQTYSEIEARKEVNKLRFTDSLVNWWYDLCEECKEFHVYRG